MNKRIVFSRRAYLTFLFIACFGFSAASASAAPLILTPGDPCGWDIGCTYLGTESGSNDSLADVEALLGVFDLFLIDKSDNSGQSNFLFNGLASDPAGSQSGTWTYTGLLVNPVRYMTIKSGNQYAIYRYEPTRSFGNWSTENLSVGRGNIPGLSHLSFFGQSAPPGTTEVPEPASALLFAASLLAAGGVKRGRKKSTQ